MARGTRDHRYRSLNAKEKRAHYNRLTLAGNVVRDPEIRYPRSGAAVTKFTIAVRRKISKADGVDAIDVVAWDNLAETNNW